MCHQQTPQAAAAAAVLRKDGTLIGSRGHLGRPGLGMRTYRTSTRVRRPSEGRELSECLLPLCVWYTEGYFKPLDCQAFVNRNVHSSLKAS